MERFRVTPSSSLWTFAWLPHAYKGPCYLGRPARRHSRMHVQLMESARLAIDSRDASPLSTGMLSAYSHMTWRPIHFKPDSNHLAKWIEPNWFQTALAQCAFNVNANQCALNRIKCALSVQCEHGFTIEYISHFNCFMVANCPGFCRIVPENIHVSQSTGCSP